MVVVSTCQAWCLSMAQGSVLVAAAAESLSAAVVKAEVCALLLRRVVMLAPAVQWQVVLATAAVACVSLVVGMWAVVLLLTLQWRPGHRRARRSLCQTLQLAAPPPWTSSPPLPPSPSTTS
jgi:hypothetical protein